jgi:putative SOS response-associated peptidase YedK
MCANYTPSKRSVLRGILGFDPELPYPPEAYPSYAAPILVPSREGQGMDARLATFGLIPFWAKDRSFAKRTYNARTETIAEKPSFRGSWKARRFCLVPMERFYEPCWETGKAVKWSIHRKDSAPFAVAGIWDSWTDKDTGEIVMSFSMLTINGDGHPVMGRFHRPGDERRSLVVVDSSNWSYWLTATTEQANALLLTMSPDEFTATPAMQAPAQLEL